MTLDFQRQDTVQLSDFNLTDSRFKVTSGRASPLCGDNRL